MNNMTPKQPHMNNQASWYNLDVDIRTSKTCLNLFMTLYKQREYSCCHFIIWTSLFMRRRREMSIVNWREMGWEWQQGSHRDGEVCEELGVEEASSESLKGNTQHGFISTIVNMLSSSSGASSWILYLLSCYKTTYYTKYCISVTYYLELRNAIIIYCISHFLATKGQIGCLDVIEH